MASLLGSPNLTKPNFTADLTLNHQVVLAAFTVLELGLDVVMSWAPGYLLAKMAFLAWCMAPIHENGSNVIFNQVCPVQCLAGYYHMTFIHILDVYYKYGVIIVDNYSYYTMRIVLNGIINY